MRDTIDRVAGRCDGCRKVAAEAFEAGARSMRERIEEDIRAVAIDWREAGGREGALKSYGADYLLGRIAALPLVEEDK